MNAPVSIGEVIGQRYRVDEIVGEGGMGVVVKATHVVLQQLVALKFVRRELMANEDAVARFVREARSLARVKSEHVVRVHDVATLPDGTPFIVMEYLEGYDLATLLTKSGPLEPPLAVRYISQTCEALAETHAAGIVHSDLKPENIYITKGVEGPGRVKLLDFGISRIVTDRTKTDLGTPGYMAPEQFEGGTVDLRSDVWSAGAVLYEMLSGRQPFAADTDDAIRERVLSGEPDPLPSDSVPSALAAIVSKCLSRDSANRYANTIELVGALEEFMPPDTTSQRLQPVAARIELDRKRRHEPTVVLPGRRSPRRWGAVLLLLVVAVAVAAFVVTSRRHPQSPTATAATSEPSTASATPNPVAPAAVEVTVTASAPGDPVVAAAPSQAKTSKVTLPRPKAPPVVPRRSNPPVNPSPTPAAGSDGDRFGPRK
jgi:serine/threonine-protein kinase